jgi:hypothetical protein
MNARFRFVFFRLFVLQGLILAGSACTPITNQTPTSTLPQEVRATFLPAPSATPMTTTPTVSAALIPATGGQLPPGVLYQDDFTNPASGWPNAVTYDNYFIGYHEPTYYHVDIHVPHDRALVALPKKTFTDSTIETKTFTEPNNTSASGDFRYGLFFRRTGNQYYAPRPGTFSKYHQRVHRS